MQEPSESRRRVRSLREELRGDCEPLRWVLGTELGSSESREQLLLLSHLSAKPSLVCYVVLGFS